MSASGGRRGMARQRIAGAKRAAAVAALGILAIAVVAGVAGAARERTYLISRADGAGGAPGNGPSQFPSVSDDGNLVAFRSDAANLVPDDPDRGSDVYVRDRRTNRTTLVSRASGAGGEKGNGSSFNPRISGNGRYIVYRSVSDNLHPDDTDGRGDVFMRDLRTDETVLVSRASGASGVDGDRGSRHPSISRDGSVVAFMSESKNLVPEDTDSQEDVFVRHLKTNETELISRASGANGEKGNRVSEFPVISSDGTLVAFRTEADNIHPDDRDKARDIVARDLDADETILVSRASGANGRKGNGISTFASVSGNGRFVAFDSLADNLDRDDPDAVADVFLRDLKRNRTSLVSRSGLDGPKADGGSAEPNISNSGRYIAFHSTARNLDPYTSGGFELDAFVRDRKTGQTSLLSRRGRFEANRPSEEPWIAGGGDVVAFHSEATNLSKADDTADRDVYARDVPARPRCARRKATEVAAIGGVTRGSRKRDVIVGTPGRDKIRTGRGKDIVCGLGGRDVIRAGRGRDRVHGGKGRDRIRGGKGRDRLKGNRGRDRIRGGKGRDRLKGNRGRDRLIGGPGRDRCRGGKGRDRTKRC